MTISDKAINRLREVVYEPDLSGTRYRITGIAGHGGMGTVFEAEDTTLHRRVALKVIQPQKLFWIRVLSTDCLRRRGFSHDSSIRASFPFTTPAFFRTAMSSTR